jgi:hypothetical protein
MMIAMADPLDEGLVDEVRFTAGLDLQIVTADVAAIRKKIDEVYGDSAWISRSWKPSSPARPLRGHRDRHRGRRLGAPRRPAPRDRGAAGHPPGQRHHHRSDPPRRLRHPHPAAHQERGGALPHRRRADRQDPDPHQQHQSLVSRLKIMSELDISERRRPQDGRITVKTPMRMVDLRISTLPTINGEKVVMRILDRNSAVHSWPPGLLARRPARVTDMVAKPQGIILATGPTGSGKTTTLYSLLQHDATPDKNYVTIEDPVEYYLDMAGQVLVREKIGLTFPSVLRALLRRTRTSSCSARSAISRPPRWPSTPR